MTQLSPEEVTISCNSIHCGFSIRARVNIGPGSQIHFLEKECEKAIAEHHRVTGKNNHFGGHWEYDLIVSRSKTSLGLVVHGEREIDWMVEDNA